MSASNDLMDGVICGHRQINMAVPNRALNEIPKGFLGYYMKIYATDERERVGCAVGEDDESQRAFNELARLGFVHRFKLIGEIHAMVFPVPVSRDEAKRQLFAQLKEGLE